MEHLTIRGIMQSIVCFAFDVMTGRPLDCMGSEKCRTCKDCHTYNKSQDTCPENKFHGKSGDMEKHNILRLFRNSTRLGFRYTGLIMDGDCSVLSAIQQEKPYGDSVKIEKMECKNHFRK